MVANYCRLFFGRAPYRGLSAQIMLSLHARCELLSSVVGGCMHPMHAGVFECCHVLSWVVSGGRIVVGCGQSWSECGLGLSFSPRGEVRSVRSRLHALRRAEHQGNRICSAGCQLSGRVGSYASGLMWARGGGGGRGWVDSLGLGIGLMASSRVGAVRAGSGVVRVSW